MTKPGAWPSAVRPVGVPEADRRPRAKLVLEGVHRRGRVPRPATRRARRRPRRQHIFGLAAGPRAGPVELRNPPAEGGEPSALVASEFREASAAPRPLARGGGRAHAHNGGVGVIGREQVGEKAGAIVVVVELLCEHQESRQTRLGVLAGRRDPPMGAAMPLPTNEGKTHHRHSCNQTQLPNVWADNATSRCCWCCGAFGDDDDVGVASTNVSGIRVIIIANL